MNCIVINLYLHIKVPIKKKKKNPSSQGDYSL